MASMLGCLSLADLTCRMQIDLWHNDTQAMAGLPAPAPAQEAERSGGRQHLWSSVRSLLVSSRMRIRHGAQTRLRRPALTRVPAAPRLRPAALSAPQTPYKPVCSPLLESYTE